MAASKDIRRIQRASNKDMAKLLLSVIRAGYRYKMTKSGVLFYGTSGGQVSTHLTCSDHRAVANFRRDLRNIGITIERK
ncbi:HicA-like toxin [Arthrobacter phage SilentRX]|uniref:HicA-like toxin n=1 Tax=Arthrobacter phage SilentRX TaxID=2836091 RepID=A0A8F3E7G4_9CAUD|nr:HicA-like toxin [Arthrobacter phage SilentRX]QWY82795.1 HicA-like toxin [Arthrobacter phage SilentRX]